MWMRSFPRQGDGDGEDNKSAEEMEQKKEGTVCGKEMVRK